jgi:hypothetical protein
VAKAYYVVYSVRSKLGSGFGRNTLTCDRDIDTMDRIEQVEKELLKVVQEIEPDAGYSHLFLVNWRELSPAVPNGESK